MQNGPEDSAEREYEGQESSMMRQRRQGVDRVSRGGGERKMRRYGCTLRGRGLCDVNGSSTHVTAAYATNAWQHEHHVRSLKPKMGRL